MLNKRCRSITLDIIKKPSKLSELAHKYKVSERTIRKDLNSINYFLAQSNFSEISKDVNKNYCLALEKENTKIIFKIINSHEIITESYSNKERLLELFYILSSNSVPLKLEHIANMLFVSKRSIINDTELLRKALVPYNITIPGCQEGIFIKGNEINIRLALVTLFFENMDKLIISDLTKLIKQKDLITSYKVYWRLFEKVDLAHIIEVVESTKNYLSIHLSDYAYLYSIACFSLALKRHQMNMIGSTNYKYANPTTKQIINNIFEQLFKNVQNDNEKEKDYIFEILLRLSHDFYLYEVKDKYIEFIQLKSDEFNTKINKFYHMNQATKDNIKREIIKIYITNKLNYNEDKNIIELDDDFYKKIYNKVKEIILECQFGFDFNYDNYWQIAWHIINYEQIKNSTKKNVVIVSDKPSSLNEILIKNLNRLFDIEILGITSLNQLDKYKDFYLIDYYISTLDIPVTNVLKVHPLLSLSEINYLKQYLDTYTNEKSSTNDEIETLSYILDNKVEDILKFIDDTVQAQNIIHHSILDILKDNYNKVKTHPLILNNTTIFNLREHEIVKKNCVISLTFKNKNMKFLFLNSQHTYLKYILEFQN